MDEGVFDTQTVKRYETRSQKNKRNKGENIMKKRILSMFIAVLMVALMIPFSALTAFAAENVAVLGIELDRTTATYDLRRGKTAY